MQNCQKTRELTESNCSGAFAATPGKGSWHRVSCPGRVTSCNTRAAPPDKVPAHTSRQTTTGAPQNGLATHRGVQEHPRGRDPALLQAQAPTVLARGTSAQQGLWSARALVLQKVFGVCGREGWTPPCRCTSPCESPQQGLLPAHPSKVDPGTRHSPRNLMPFPSTAVANVYFSAFSQFT